MFLLPLAMMAFAGLSAPPDTLTPPAPRVRVELIRVVFSPQDQAALGGERSLRNASLNKFRVLNDYAVHHHLIKHGTVVGEGIVQDGQPALIGGDQFSSLRVTGNHIHLTDWQDARNAASHARVPTHFTTEIGADSGGVVPAGLIILDTQWNIASMTFTRLTLLP